MLLKLFVVVLTLSQVLGSSPAGSTFDRQRLLSDLMKNYQRAIDPDSTPLKMALSYMCADLNKETHELTSKLLEKFTWKDNRLTWRPENYGDTKQIRVPASLIWTPDVKLYTTQNKGETRDDVNVVVMSDGTVLWIPLVIYKTHCTPPSSHEGGNQEATCKIRVGSWTYDAHQLDLQLDGEGFDTAMYLDTCPYTIHDAKVKVESKVYPCCPEPYANMDVEFKVQPRQ